LAGGTSFVSESGSCGLKVLPPFVVDVVPGVVVVAGMLVVTSEVGTGEVTEGIETARLVVSPELSLPHPAAISPMASARAMTARYRRVTTR
jgi:hypothetical protein